MLVVPVVVFENEAVALNALDERGGESERSAVASMSSFVSLGDLPLLLLFDER